MFCVLEGSGCFIACVESCVDSRRVIGTVIVAVRIAVRSVFAEKFTPLDDLPDVSVGADEQSDTISSALLPFGCAAIFHVGGSVKSIIADLDSFDGIDLGAVVSSEVLAAGTKDMSSLSHLCTCLAPVTEDARWD